MLTRPALRGIKRVGEAIEQPSFFFDDFESGDLSSVGDDGFEWGGSVYTSVVTDDAYEGSNSLRFRWTAEGNENSEQNYDLGAKYSEIWFSYYIKWPSNYYHRNSGGPHQTYNNKGYFYIWGGNYETPTMEAPGCGPNFWPDGNGYSTATINVWSNNYPAGWHHDDPARANDLWVDSDDLNTWVRIIGHYKLGTFDPGTVDGVGDGVIQFWKVRSDQTVITLFDRDDVNLFQTGQTGWDKGYILGSANSAFANQTDAYIDNFRLSSSEIARVF